MLSSSPCPLSVYPADSQNLPVPAATVATCPEPVPAPGVDLGLLLPLGEKIDIGNPNISWCRCSLEEEAVPCASDGCQGCAVEQPFLEMGLLVSCGL